LPILYYFVVVVFNQFYYGLFSGNQNGLSKLLHGLDKQRKSFGRGRKIEGDRMQEGPLHPLHQYGPLLQRNRKSHSQIKNSV
jgi:hypothetical protein